MDFPQRYEHLTQWIVSQCPEPDKFAHMAAGMLFWLLGAIVLRKPLHSVWPLALIIILEIANELIDYLARYPAFNQADTVSDMAATWFWPFVISFFLATMPRLRSGQNS